MYDSQPVQPTASSDLLVTLPVVTQALLRLERQQQQREQREQQQQLGC